MLQKIGDSLKGKKILAWIILAPLALVFVAWGATGAVNLDFMGPQIWRLLKQAESGSVGEHVVEREVMFWA